MAFVAGKNITFTLNAVALTSFISNISLTRSADNLDVTTFGNDDRDFIQGLKSAGLTISGYFDPNASTGPDKVLDTAYNTGTGVSFNMTILGSPNVQYTGTCLVDNYETTGVVDNLAAFSASLRVSGPVTRT